MSEAMTTEECRRSQRECSLRVGGEIEKLRRETKEDIALIREAVQNVDRAVASIKGFLGINGGGTPVHPHKRDSEQDEHLHRRLDDIEIALSANTKPRRDWRVTVMWAVGVFMAGIVMTLIVEDYFHRIPQKENLTITK